MEFVPVMPLNLPPMRKGLPTGETCNLCGQPIYSGQLVSGVLHSTAPPLTEDGVRMSDEGYYYGHYACLVQMLGPEETLMAIHDGRLPAINPAILVDGCLPSGMGGL